MSTTERHYVGEQGRAYHVDKRAIPERALPWVSRIRAEKFQKLVRPTDTVFEFGAGLGWNLLGLQCARRVGYDVSGFRCEGIEWVPDIDSLPRGFANLVICHHVLEHVIHPAETLAMLRNLLAPMGRLLLYVPYEKERRYRTFRLDEANHHLYSWNVQTLANLLMERGFTVDLSSVGLTGYDCGAASLAVKLGIGERGFRFIRSAAQHVFRPQEISIVAAACTIPQ